MISDNQYCFRERHSTWMTLLNIIDQISQETENKNISIDFFLDLSKAFDTIDHSLFLKKLEIYGIRGNALHWISSYLSDRSQCVSIDGVLSNSEKIIYGVSQGSVLGPLLFILHIYDIVIVSTILELIIFADDTNVFAAHKNADQRISIINTELIKVVNWLKINKLNVKKTTFFFSIPDRKKSFKMW